MGLTSGFNLLTTPQKVIIASTQTAGTWTSLELDCSIEETHTAEAKITEYEVEQGSDISDNSRPKPEELTIHFFISNFPITIPFTQPPSVSNSAGTDAYTLLTRYKNNAEVLRITTTLRVYDSMLIQSISSPRKASNTNGWEATAKFKQLFTVRSQEGPAPVPLDVSKNAAKTVGKTAPKVADKDLQSGAFKLGVHAGLFNPS